MIVSDSTIQAEVLGDFFKNLGKKGLNVSKKMAKNVLKNPGRALEIGANVGTAFASRNPKAALTSLPEVIIFLSYRKKTLSWKICINTHIRVRIKTIITHIGVIICTFYIINGTKL